MRNGSIKRRWERGIAKPEARLWTPSLSRASNLNGRGGLDDMPFSFRESKDGTVSISWRGQQAAVLKGRKASSFLSRLERLDAQGQQLEMAKVTGNFKRGNERAK